ncbi:MAG: hypothetical protein CBHOC_5402, partial [uncultured Caballeronia sp.]
MSQPPPLTISIDPRLAGMLIANMLEAWLVAGFDPAPVEETADAPQDHATASQQTSYIYIYIRQSTLA